MEEEMLPAVKIVNVHHANVLNPYINYPFLSLKALRSFVDRRHSEGRRVKVYYTIRELTNHVPEIWALRSLGDEILRGGGGGGCGNGVCEPALGEDCLSCPADCNGKQGGKPANRFCCGDGDGQNPLGCGDPLCSQGGFSCTDVPTATSCCGDSVCEGAETECLCAVDCGGSAATETSCDNGADDDCDGAIDCADVDCRPFPGCLCAGQGAICNVNADCCSGNCKRNGTCR